MARLRDPEKGCPWDIQQDFKSLIPYTLEEAYEVIDAIERQDFTDLKDELGDLLLQVVFHSRVAEELNLFDFNQVAEAISTKLIRRHPHVFSDKVFESDAERQSFWENSKLTEHSQKTGESPESVLSNIAASLPALVYAQKLQKRAARHGFDWREVPPVFDKVKEELEEVQEAYASGDSAHIEEEIGDLLFTVVNLARHLDVDAESALRNSSSKFTRRFQTIETRLHPQSLSEVSDELLEKLWDEAKR